jgi:putative thioredoxin
MIPMADIGNQRDYIIDTTSAAFARDVIETSKQVPVVVDFWAPWCAPCRALKPVLEKLALEYQGRFRLVKLNTDEHPDIAGQYGVRGIPNVKAFVDGNVANEFTGALPEARVRAFIESLIPSPAQQLQRVARDDVWAGRFAAAEERLREALALDARLNPAWVDLAELLLARQAIDEAAEALEHVDAADRDERAERLAARIDIALKSRALPDVAALAAQVEADPGDPEARLRLAERLAAEGRYQAGLEAYLEVVRTAGGDARERARRGMLEVFSVATDDPDLVSRFRRQLAAALN